jgi:hypothetical protein
MQRRHLHIKNGKAEFLRDYVALLQSIKEKEKGVSRIQYAQQCQTHTRSLGMSILHRKELL